VRTFSVDARPGKVQEMLRERGIIPSYCEWDDQACITEVGIRTERDTKALVLDLARSGWRWWRGQPRAGHSDPTYAQAAQRILRRR
jgi:hypothetical protein